MRRRKTDAHFFDPSPAGTGGVFYLHHGLRHHHGGYTVDWLKLCDADKKSWERPIHNASHGIIF
jgi:hypothetical protein